MFENTGAGTVTINTAMGVTSTAASTIFFLGGTNTGNNTFAGAIADPTGTNTLGIGKSGTGKWILSNNTNSYQGPVVIHDGTLSVGVIDVAANAQPLGQGSLIQFGYRTANTGTLEYTGAAIADTDKQIMVGQADRANNGNFRGGAVILNNGDGTLTFSNDTFNSTTGMSTTGTGHVRNITLGGTNTGANTISGTIRNNNTTIGALVSLTKTGAGTWILEGDNTYTGATSVTGGTLLINGNSSTATGAVSVTGGTLGGIGTVGGATSIGAAGTLSPGQSPGTMTFVNTLSLAGSTIMEIDGTNGAGVTGGHDFVNLTGAGAAGVLTYGGTMTLDIGVLFGAGSYSWNLFDFASESLSVTSAFTGITLDDQYSGSLTDSGGGVWGLVDGNNTWSFTESDGVLGLTVIPEPRAALLGGLGLLALLRRRR
jgi:autotransporter-associated beta strand protein